MAKLSVKLLAGHMQPGRVCAPRRQQRVDVFKPILLFSDDLLSQSQ